MSNTLDDARTRLLDTAGQVFAEKGFKAATVREICSAAGANIAAVNYYFGDKQRLYVEAVKYAHMCRFSEVPAFPEGMAAEVKLVAFIRGMLTNILDKTRPDWHAKLMLREMVEPTEACRELTEQRIRPMSSILFGIVSELLPPGVPKIQIHLTAFSVIGQCLFYKVQEPVARQLMPPGEFDALTIDQITQHIAGVMLTALGRTLPAQPIAARSASEGISAQGVQS
jgi:AcrR family transcriptional regulator